MDLPVLRWLNILFFNPRLGQRICIVFHQGTNLIISFTYIPFEVVYLLWSYLEFGSVTLFTVCRFLARAKRLKFCDFYGSRRFLLRCNCRFALPTSSLSLPFTIFVQGLPEPTQKLFLYLPKSLPKSKIQFSFPLISSFFMCSFHCQEVHFSEKKLPEDVMFRACKIAW